MKKNHGLPLRILRATCRSESRGKTLHALQAYHLHPCSNQINDNMGYRSSPSFRFRNAAPANGTLARAQAKAPDEVRRSWRLTWRHSGLQYALCLPWRCAARSTHLPVAATTTTSGLSHRNFSWSSTRLCLEMAVSSSSIQSQLAIALKQATQYMATPQKHLWAFYLGGKSA